MSAHIAERRPLGALGRMSLVAAIHVAVLFGIMRSMGISIVHVPEPPRIDAKIEPVERTTQPPPLDPYVVPQERWVLPLDPPPEPAFDQDVISEPPPISGDIIDRPPTGDNIPRPVIQGVRPDPRFPLSKPEYSARMIREGNEGTIEIEVYVLPNGRVGDARVAKSTGFEDLDRAALAEAKRNWRLMPATSDGAAIAQWHRLRVTFKLNGR